jgi:DNA-directed RNA polymerase subunit M/transcription elongation factor TFIIS
MNCPNCNSALSCSCQKRTASDGKQVCSSCLPAYEKTLASIAVNNYQAKKP